MLVIKIERKLLVNQDYNDKTKFIQIIVVTFFISKWQIELLLTGLNNKSQTSSNLFFGNTFSARMGNFCQIYNKSSTNPYHNPLPSRTFQKLTDSNQSKINKAGQSKINQTIQYQINRKPDSMRLIRVKSRMVREMEQEFFSFSQAIFT